MIPAEPYEGRFRFRVCCSGTRQRAAVAADESVPDPPELQAPPETKPEESEMFPEGTPDMPALPDMQSLLAQAAEMQEQLLKSQEQLGDARVEGTSGGGAVTASMSGTGELVGLVIDPAVCDPAEAETLADLVVAAVRAASANAQRLASEQMSGFTDAFGEGGTPPGQLGF
jgi:DNA-binding YbaB/EbfC family protein